jgi:RND family efflux transporter MFP subunit
MMFTTYIKTSICTFGICAVMAFSFFPAAGGAQETGRKDAAKLSLHVIRTKTIIVKTPIIGTGTIYAEKTSKIGPLVEGQVMRVHVKVGDHVEKGDPLFQIRSDSYRFIHEEAKAALEVTRAKLEEAEPAYKRAKKLYERGTVPLAQLDKARSVLAQVRAGINSAKVAVERTKKDLDDTIAYAPFNGVITSRYVDEGIFLSNRVPGGNSAIIELKKIDVVRAIVQIPARQLEKLYIGEPVRLIIDGIAKPVKARVSIINDKVDVATRTVEVRIRIANKTMTIKPGLFVRAEIQPKGHEAVVLPRHVVLGSISRPYVFVPIKGKALRRNVRILDLDAMNVEVIHGLKSGDVVLSGPDLKRLSNGTAIGELGDVAG